LACGAALEKEFSRMMGTGSVARYDIFVSLAGPDRPTVRPIIAALQAQGLKLFVDEQSIEVHERITWRISEGLANSAAILTYYSRTYPTRWACQRELTAAFLAAKRTGTVAGRILVINPESGEDHIEPVELRDLRFQPANVPGRERERWSADVARRVRTLQGSLGSLTTIPAESHWWPAWPMGGDRIGRYPELWRLHSALHARDFGLVENTTSVAVAVVHGPMPLT